IINEIKDCNEYNVIGIDRGERNLISLCIINQNGEIILQKEMNVIQSSDKYNVDYNEKLEIKSKERDNAKKNWSEIGKIKDLKSGYLSAVVHEIVKLAIEYNAVITLEDLNGGFKNSRKKVDKQIYQKFE
ncbi:type V CRISPR-associated protein Cpf1, partial [Sneathia sp. DSM 16630]|nr:type V CRISPR-associated protein Cpf1 [Sneathia sp. DSM 16630]